MTMSLFLDLKLALRMLVKYPLLTFVGSLGIAFGIAAGVGGFELRSKFLDPTLPLDEGGRIVGLRNWDTRADRPGPLGDADFRTWLEQLQRIDDLGAAAFTEQNLTVNGDVEPIAVAEMTASGFRVARVPRCSVERSSRAMRRWAHRQWPSSVTPCGSGDSSAIPASWADRFGSASSKPRSWA
jgi:hypothetical protein